MSNDSIYATEEATIGLMKDLLARIEACQLANATAFDLLAQAASHAAGQDVTGSVASALIEARNSFALQSNDEGDLADMTAEALGVYVDQLTE